MQYLSRGSPSLAVILLFLFHKLGCAGITCERKRHCVNTLCGGAQLEHKKRDGVSSAVHDCVFEKNVLF